MPAKTPAERRLAGSIGAHVSWANTENPSARTEAARSALLDRFLRQAGGDPIRAEHLRKAYYKQLSLKAQKARRLAQENDEIAERAAAELDALGGEL